MINVPFKTEPLLTAFKSAFRNPNNTFPLRPSTFPFTTLFANFFSAFQGRRSTPRLPSTRPIPRPRPASPPSPSGSTPTAWRGAPRPPTPVAPPATWAAPRASPGRPSTPAPPTAHTAVAPAHAPACPPTASAPPPSSVRVSTLSVTHVCFVVSVGYFNDK